MSTKPQISAFHLSLLSTGGMIGAGWLFSPFYGFQVAGVGVLISWIVTAVLSLIIGLAFAEVATALPIVGGTTRLVGVTHNRTLAFTFLALNWISYTVYLPIEAQSAIQYLGFWFHGLVSHNNNQVELSHLGLMVAVAIILLITWFNTLIITKVAKANSWVSIWKIIIPFSLAMFFIFKYGSFNNVHVNYTSTGGISFEHILLAITGSGLAFAFSGFQNGLFLANSAKNPGRSIPYSLIIPIVIGTIIYASLSLTFIMCLNNNQNSVVSAVAPLLGLVALFSLNIIYTILFVDAVIAPLGTANVYTAVTGRILYGFAKDFFAKTKLLKLNESHSPYVCLWLNAFIGILFLLPFPTWKQLVNFLSSVVVFAYLAGPLSLIILREVAPELPRKFKLSNYKVIGYLAFVCCSLLIYWSGLDNLIWVCILLIVVIMGYSFTTKSFNLFAIIKNNIVVISYMLSLTIVSYLREKNLVLFPFDNLLIIVSGLVFCKLLINQKLTNQEINQNLELVKLEVEQG